MNSFLASIEDQEKWGPYNENIANYEHYPKSLVLIGVLSGTDRGDGRPGGAIGLNRGMKK